MAGCLPNISFSWVAVGRALSGVAACTDAMVNFANSPATCVAAQVQLPCHWGCDSYMLSCCCRCAAISVGSYVPVSRSTTCGTFQLFTLAASPCRTYRRAFGLTTNFLLRLITTSCTAISAFALISKVFLKRLT